MNKLKHNKLRNTGLFFEILTRNVMHEALNPIKPQSAIKIIKKHFVQDSELYKELGLYRTLTVSTEHNPHELLSLTIESRKKLDDKKLLNEKYNLVKSIKKYYNIEEFFNSKVENYKTLGSIYKIFEYNGHDNPLEFLDVKKTLTESLSNKPIQEQDDVEKVWVNEDPDIRTLGFKIIVEKFNEKYRELEPRQKKLLGKYINEDSNTSDFKDYVLSEVRFIEKTLNRQKELIDDGIMKIKLDEVIHLTNQIKVAKTIKEDHLSSLLKYYELCEVLTNNE